MNQPASDVSNDLRNQHVRYPEFWNLIIIVPGTEASDKTSLVDVADEFDIAELGEFLRTNSHLQPERAIATRSPVEIRALEKRAGRRAGSNVYSLNTFWRLQLDNTQDMNSVLAEMRNIDDDRFLVYEESGACSPSPDVSDNIHEWRQDYLDAAPEGVDARWAWTQPNGQGQGVKVIDLEIGWRLTHVDLPPVELLSGDNDLGPSSLHGAHGTWVLGVIGGVNNDIGIIGVSPSLSALDVVSHYKSESGVPSWWHIEEAIIAATDHLSEGDVLLLEVERCGDHTPAEADPLDCSAIYTATGLGIVVVEAAGNGGFDLTTWQDEFGESPFNCTSEDFCDSGAIIVGSAVDAVTGSPDGHERLDLSNYGCRVDCYAWGNNVTTTGAGSLPPGAPIDEQYNVNFGGTSAASAIIAGTAAITQAWCRGRYGEPLEPWQLRSVFSNPRFGTPQANISGDPIGVMPNLKKILSWRLTWLRIWWCITRRFRYLATIFGVKLHGDQSDRRFREQSG